MSNNYNQTILRKPDFKWFFCSKVLIYVAGYMIILGWTNTSKQTSKSSQVKWFVWQYCQNLQSNQSATNEYWYWLIQSIWLQSAIFFYFNLLNWVLGLQSGLSLILFERAQNGLWQLNTSFMKPLLEQFWGKWPNSVVPKAVVAPAVSHLCALCELCWCVEEEGAEIDRAVTAFRPRKITSLTLIIHFKFNVSVGAFHYLLVLQLPLRFCNFYLVTMGNSYSSSVLQLSLVEAAGRVD